MKTNQQQPEASVVSQSLEIVDYWLTIQGEGEIAGTPAWFVRLAGCNLQCPLCDTDYTSNRRRINKEDLYEYLKGLSRRNRPDYIDPEDVPIFPAVIVFTGGEPFRQIHALIETIEYFNDREGGSDYHRLIFQIETNGTLYPTDVSYQRRLDDLLDRNLLLSVSPKGRVHPALMEAGTFKFVVAHDSELDERGLPTHALGRETPINYGLIGDHQILIQPQDSQDPEENKKNIDKAVSICLRYGYGLSLQQHKYIGVR